MEKYSVSGTSHSNSPYILIDLLYLPPLAYFCSFLDTKGIVIEKHAHYTKQSYQNRCCINTANGVLKLIVPIARKHGKSPVNKVEIDYNSKWQHHHWRAIESAYRKAPFFDHYANGLYPILFHKHQYLYDLNLKLLFFCLASLSLSIPITETRSYQKMPQNSTIKDIRSTIHPKKHGHSQLFYAPCRYFQIFGTKFVGNLSIIDLLFCEGPKAINVLKRSIYGSYS